MEQAFAVLAADQAEDGRFLEIAEILATGLVRLGARKSRQKPAEPGESSLHFTPDQSRDPPPYSAEVSP